MGKHEKGTPKEIANRCKSKGLQKLRWFCQMCNKQCRDQNGFKCHLTSEAHQRQLLLFAENQNQYLAQFSREFESNFMFLLKNSFGGKRTRANEIYQEYIRDKGHVHMNSTRWHTLTGFVQYLGSSGKCKIDQTEKGWYIAYIDQEEVNRKEEVARKAKQEKDDEEKQHEMIEAQAARALELRGEVEESKPTELIRGDEDDKVAFSLAKKDVKPTAEDLAKPTPALIAASGSVFDRKNVKKEIKDELDREKRREKDRDGREKRRRSRSRSRSRDNHRDRRDNHRDDKRRDDRPSTSRRDEPPKKKSALDEIREMEERKKEKQNRKDYWMHPGIVVKIMTKKLGADYYKAKGVVKTMIDDYTASVKLDDGVLVKVDQSHVETVIPQAGRDMIICNGAYRGIRAVLDSLDEKNFSLNLTLAEGLLKGRKVQVAYEDASKAA